MSALKAHNTSPVSTNYLSTSLFRVFRDLHSCGLVVKDLSFDRKETRSIQL